MIASGILRCLVVLGSILATLCSLAGPAPSWATIIAQSTFDNDTEGWTGIIIDGAGNITPGTVSFAGGSGNPGGALRTDAPSDNKTSFFLASSFIVDALHSAIDGSISWDLATINQSGDVFFNFGAPAFDINIRAGSDRIRLAVTPPAPTIFPVYSHYDLGFGVADGWLFFDGTTTTTATQAEIDSVLAGAQSLIIRAEYWSSATPDTTFLDNVTITTPEPSTFLLTALGSAALGARLWSRRRQVGR